MVHFEVLPSATDDSDMLCGDVRALESLVMTTSDEMTAATLTDDDPTASVDLALPVGCLNDLLNGSLQQLSANLQSIVEPVVNGSDLSISMPMKQGKVRIPSLKKPTPKTATTAGAGVVPNSAGSGATSEVADTAKKYANAHMDESATCLFFENWLASVTERINQTMHFQMSGSPDPLVFQVKPSSRTQVFEIVSAD